MNRILSKSRFVFLSLAVLTCAGCATLAPSDVRRTESIETTTAPKAIAFTRANAYIAKTWGNSNAAIRMRDENAAQIVVKGNTSCNVFRQTGDPKDYTLEFTLDFTAKDNRVRLSFEDLQMSDDKGKPFLYAYGQITDASQLEKAKPCLEPIRKGIITAVNGAANNW